MEQLSGNELSSWQRQGIYTPEKLSIISTHCKSFILFICVFIVINIWIFLEKSFYSLTYVFKAGFVCFFFHSFLFCFVFLIFIYLSIYLFEALVRKIMKRMENNMKFLISLRKCFSHAIFRFRSKNNLWCYHAKTWESREHEV